MGKLNRFFATNTTLAEGSFWRRCLPTPPALPRVAPCPLCAAGGRGQERCPRSRSRSTGGTRGPAFVSRGHGRLDTDAGGSGSGESGHGSSRA